MPVVTVGGMGVSSSFENYENEVMTKKKGGAAYQYYNVYNKNKTEIPKSVESPYLDSLTNALVMACRAN
jgi:hypothetical protein